MNSSTTTADWVSAHRASLQGYLVVLVGLMLIAENVSSGVATGGFLTNVGGVVLGVLAVGGGAFGYLRPEQLPRGTEPAPGYLYVLAGVATVAFLLSMFFGYFLP